MMISALLAAQLTAVSVPAQPLPPEPIKADAIAAPQDSPEEIAKDAARDLKDNRFYNRPGATRAQYDAAWQECRLIARGTRTPTGTYTYIYNPAVISPAAAAVGGGIGAAIGQAIVEGQIRRANRMQCLLIHGWRLVELDAAETAKVAAMSDADRSAYFNTIIGAPDPKGKKVVSWTNAFAAPNIAQVSDQ